MTCPLLISWLLALMSRVKDVAFGDKSWYAMLGVPVRVVLRSLKAASRSWVHLNSLSFSVNQVKTKVTSA